MARKKPHPEGQKPKLEKTQADLETEKQEDIPGDSPEAQAKRKVAHDQHVDRLLGRKGHGTLEQRMSQGVDASKVFVVKPSKRKSRPDGIKRHRGNKAGIERSNYLVFDGREGDLLDEPNERTSNGKLLHEKMYRWALKEKQRLKKEGRHIDEEGLRMLVHKTALMTAAAKMQMRMNRGELLDERDLKSLAEGFAEVAAHDEKNAEKHPDWDPLLSVKNKKDIQRLLDRVPEYQIGAAEKKVGITLQAMKEAFSKLSDRKLKSVGGQLKPRLDNIARALGNITRAAEKYKGDPDAFFSEDVEETVQNFADFYEEIQQHYEKQRNEQAEQDEGEKKKIKHKPISSKDRQLISRVYSGVNTALSRKDDPAKRNLDPAITRKVMSENPPAQFGADQDREIIDLGNSVDSKGEDRLDEVLRFTDEIDSETRRHVELAKNVEDDFPTPKPEQIKKVDEMVNYSPEELQSLLKDWKPQQIEDLNSKSDYEERYEGEKAQLPLYIEQLKNLMKDVRDHIAKAEIYDKPGSEEIEDLSKQLAEFSSQEQIDAGEFAEFEVAVKDIFRRYREMGMRLGEVPDEAKELYDGMMRVKQESKIVAKRAKPVEVKVDTEENPYLQGAEESADTETSEIEADDAESDLEPVVPQDFDWFEGELPDSQHREAEQVSEKAEEFRGHLEIFERLVKSNFVKFGEWVATELEMSPEEIEEFLGGRMATILEGDVPTYLQHIAEGTGQVNDQELMDVLIENNLPAFKQWLFDNYPDLNSGDERLRTVLGQAYEDMGFDRVSLSDEEVSTEIESTDETQVETQETEIETPEVKEKKAEQVLTADAIRAIIYTKFKEKIGDKVNIKSLEVGGSGGELSISTNLDAGVFLKNIQIEGTIRAIGGRLTFEIDEMSVPAFVRSTIESNLSSLPGFVDQAVEEQYGKTPTSYEIRDGELVIEF